MRANILTTILLLFCLSTKAQNCELSYINEVKKIAINDSLTIAYKEQGNGKRTFLMIHGLGGNLTHWSNNFIENEYCIAIDLPSYGLSTMKYFQPKTDLLDFYAEIILAFIQKKKLKNVVLIGHSMGGQIAIITALKNPKSIKKLVLVSPAGFEIFEDNEAKALLSFSKPETFKNQNEAMVRSGFKRNFYEMPTSTETLIQDRLMMAKCENFNPYFQAVAGGVKGMLEHPVRKELNKIAIPTLVIFGENDELIPNKFLHKSLTINQIVDIGKDIPKAKIVLIPKAGHLVMYEQFQIFNQLVKHF
jgi:pimeloyl-ACP methyl ester carboxylesterase